MRSILGDHPPVTPRPDDYRCDAERERGDRQNPVDSFHVRLKRNDLLPALLEYKSYGVSFHVVIIRMITFTSVACEAQAPLAHSSPHYTTKRGPCGVSRELKPRPQAGAGNGCGRPSGEWMNASKLPAVTISLLGRCSHEDGKHSSFMVKVRSAFATPRFDERISCTLMAGALLLEDFGVALFPRGEALRRGLGGWGSPQQQNKTPRFRGVSSNSGYCSLLSGLAAGRREPRILIRCISILPKHLRMSSSSR